MGLPVSATIRNKAKQCRTKEELHRRERGETKPRRGNGAFGISPGNNCQVNKAKMYCAFK